MKKFFMCFVVIALSLTLLGCMTTDDYELTREPACEHDFDSEIIKNATATENGTKELTCNLCGEKETQSFSMLDRMKEIAEIRLETAHYSIKSNLLNPNSYIVNSNVMEIVHDPQKDRYFLIINIDYSAQNRMGGYTRDSECSWFGWEYNSWGSKDVPGVQYGSDEYYDVATNIGLGTYSYTYDTVAYCNNGNWG